MDQRDDGRLEDVFEDLEQQAAGMEMAERDAELADRVRGEYAAVTLADRVHASLGREVSLVLLGGETVAGLLADAGRDWCAVTPGHGRTWLVRLAAVAQAGGLSRRSLPEAARPVVARRGFGSAVHALAEESGDVLVHAATGSPVRGRVARIGSDFLEVEPAQDRVGVSVLVSTEQVRAVTTG